MATLTLPSFGTPSAKSSNPPDDSTRTNFPLTVFIGRFQPFHLGHLFVLRMALALGRHVLVLTGSAFGARGLKNFLLTSEVEALIRSCLPAEENARLHIRGIPDMYNDTAWIVEVHRAVHEQASILGLDLSDESDICLVGHSKDESSRYLTLFPRWSSREADNFQGFHASTFREAWLRDADTALAQHGDMLPPTVRDRMAEFSRSPEYAWLHEEMRDRDERWAANGGRAPFIYTCDGVVTCAGYVLLVERAKSPSRGLLSLPGGYLKDGETSRDTLTGNLVFEHGLLTSPSRSKADALEMLDHYVTADQVFDHPTRSDRGRTVSRTFLLELPPGELPPTRKGPLGTPDWYPLARLDSLRERMVDDHAHIISDMTPRSGDR